jgi:hypothetical protein
MNEADLREEVAQLRARVEQVDDWAAGVLAALRDVLLPLLKAQPDIARQVEPIWRQAAENFDLLNAGGTLPEEEDMSQEHFEPAKMLYRQFSRLEVWPGREPG